MSARLTIVVLNEAVEKIGRQPDVTAEDLAVIDRLRGIVAMLTSRPKRRLKADGDDVPPGDRVEYDPDQPQDG